MLMVVIMAVLGLILGSFACCQAWRLRMRGHRKMPKRSCCMKCRHQLAWWENIPVASWVILRGKCRKCGKSIGVAEPLTEILMGAACVGAYGAVIGFGAELSAVPVMGWVRLAVMLALLVVLGVLAVYDGKWGELPTGLLVAAIVVAALYLECREDIVIVSVVASVALAAGTYFLVYVASKGKLCGDGDWLLGAAIGLALGDWWLALLCLAVSNLLAALLSLPFGRKKIFFGPFFVIGFAIVFSLKEVVCIACLI